MCTAKVAAISLLCYLSLVVTISVSAASIRKVQLMEFTPKASDTPTPQVSLCQCDMLFWKALFGFR